MERAHINKSVIHRFHHRLNFLNKIETKLEKAKPATHRMNVYKEKQMLENFELWKSLQIKHLIEKK